MCVFALSSLQTTVQQLGPGFNVQMQKTCDACGGKGKTFKQACEICKGHKVVEESKTLDAVIGMIGWSCNQVHRVRIAYSGCLTLYGGSVHEFVTSAVSLHLNNLWIVWRLVSYCRAWYAGRPRAGV